MNIKPSRYEFVINNLLYWHTTAESLPTSLCFTLFLLIFDKEIEYEHLSLW